MAYISTKFSVGQTVYWHDDEQDAVLRGTVIELTATSRNAAKYGGGDFEVVYAVEGRGSTVHYPEDVLTEQPEFPVVVLPATVAVPTPVDSPVESCPADQF